jgi:hypothetical protein
MPANNRRGGPTHRVSHLKEAPPPGAHMPATSGAEEEEAPFVTAGNVSITLTPDEYLELVDQGAETRDGDTSIGLVAVPGPASHDQIDDEDAPLEPASCPPRAGRVAKDTLGDHDAYAAGRTGPPQLEAAPVAEPRSHSPAARSSLVAPADGDVRGDIDGDPMFERLAFASAATSPTRTLGVRGSASIEGPPVRSPRKRAARSGGARPLGRGVRRAGRRSVIAMLLGLVAVIACLVMVTLPQHPSRLAAVSSQRAASSESATLGRGVPGEAFAPKTAELAAASTQTHTAAARQRARHSLVRHRGTRNVGRRRSARPKRRQTVTKPHRRESAPVRTVPAAAPTLPTASAPASNGATSSSSSGDSSGSSGSGGSASPPAYGEGGVLGAGHAG